MGVRFGYVDRTVRLDAVVAAVVDLRGLVEHRLRRDACVAVVGRGGGGRNEKDFPGEKAAAESRCVSLGGCKDLGRALLGRCTITRSHLSGHRGVGDSSVDAHAAARHALGATLGAAAAKARRRGDGPRKGPESLSGVRHLFTF